MVMLHLDNLAKVQNMLVDSGYSGENFANAIKSIHGSSVEVAIWENFRLSRNVGLWNVLLRGMEKLRTPSSHFDRSCFTRSYTIFFIM